MRRNMHYIGIVSTIVIGWCAVAGNAWASDSFEFTRHTYDLIMRYVNFAILAGFFIKYARRPIISFLKDKRAEVRRTIDDLEEKKRGIENQIEETQKELAMGQERLELVKERIIAEGQRRKDELIADARSESAVLMESTQHKIEAMFRDTSARIRGELIDMAAQIALENLPRRVTVQDHDRWVQRWMEAAQR
jgi:F-type H+-transporting ATPase subunit b